MRKMFAFSIFLLSLLHPFACISKHPIVVLIAFDGFRYDYLSRGYNPVLKQFAANGSSAKYIMNQFPTITFVNFHSISTGMHSETHGVLGNLAFTEDFRCITYGYELFHYNEDIVPIWMLNENNGDGRHSGVMMWPGSQYKYQNKTPTFKFDFDLKVSWLKRVDTILGWIVNGTTPANLVLLYFEEPDESGHQYGPDSEEVNEQLRKIDLTMKYYLQKMVQYGISDLVNTIVLSDHGMAAIEPETIMDLDNFIDPEKYLSCGFSPGLQIQPKPGFGEEIYKNLTKAADELKTFSVYKHEDIPERWHFKNNRRKSDIYVEEKLPYVFQDAARMKGNHGYDNTEPQMHPIFMAKGPLFKRNYTTKPFENIDVYPLISHMLHLKLPPAPISPNGTLQHVKNILLDEMDKYVYDFE